MLIAFILASLSWLLTGGAWLLITWAILFLLIVLILNSIIQTSTFLQDALVRLRSNQSTQLASTSSPLSFDARDVLSHVLIDGHRQLYLDVNRHESGWPIGYPILVRNTRPVPIEITGFNVEIFGDGTRWHGFHWAVGDGVSASDGGKVIIEDRISNSNPADKGIVEIPADDSRVIRIPIYVAQIPGPKPTQVPSIMIKGKISLRCQQKDLDMSIPDYLSRPQLSQVEWDDIITHV